MALNLSAEIEIKSLWCKPEFLKDKKTVLVEICILGQKFHTNIQKMPIPLIFNDKITYKKEFCKTLTFSCMAEMMKDSAVKINLLEVNCQDKNYNCLCSCKIQLSTFLFPPSHINKFQTAKLFPHRKFNPTLKFWVDAVLYRSSVCSLTRNLAEVKNRKVLEAFKTNKCITCIPHKEDQNDSDSCVVCKSFKKYLGKEYCGHKHNKASKSTRKCVSSGTLLEACYDDECDYKRFASVNRGSKENDVKEDGDNDDDCYKSFLDDMCGCKMDVKDRYGFDDGDEDGCDDDKDGCEDDEGDDGGYGGCACESTMIDVDEDEMANEDLRCDQIIKEACCKQEDNDNKKSLERKVQFWLRQLHLLSFKTSDEFTNVMRTIYNKQYSNALLKYTFYSRKKLCNNPCHHST